MSDSTPSPRPALTEPELVPGAAVPDASKAMTTFVMVVATLYFGREVLVPVTLALLLSFLLAPLVGLLRRAHLGRVPSILLAVIVALGIILAIGGVIGTQVAELTTDLPRYASTVEAKFTSLRDMATSRIGALAARVGVPDGLPGAHPGGAAPAKAAPQGQGQGQGQAPAANAEKQSSWAPLELVQRYASPVLSPVASFFIVFIVAVFALLQQEDLRDRLIRLFGSDDLHRTTVAIDDAGRRLSRYFVTQLSVNVAFGVVVGIGLTLIGVPNPLLFAVLAGLLRFVPYLGTPIAAVLPVVLALAAEPGWSMALWTAGLFLVAESLTGQVIEPMLYGHSTGLSPFSVVVAAIFWSWVWGPIGLILSTPLTLCLVVVGRHVQRLEFLDIMLGDRPALTPVESFYQRILAGDADEAQDHAERLLADCTLTDYYDNVALSGLRLAANDAQRGVLSHEQLDRVRHTITLLVHGLDGHDDKPDNADDARQVAVPEAEKQAEPESAPVLCIAGRGPLDAAASAMLAQLLAKRGLRTREVSYQDVSRDRIDALDVAAVRIACVAYLDLSGRPAHLRYLLRRLRQRLPRATPILVGLWAEADSALTDPAVRAQLGADFVTGSLAEAVASCLDVTQGDRAEAAETVAA